MVDVLTLRWRMTMHGTIMAMVGDGPSEDDIGIAYLVEASIAEHIVLVHNTSLAS